MWHPGVNWLRVRIERPQKRIVRRIIFRRILLFTCTLIVLNRVRLFKWRLVNVRVSETTHKIEHACSRWSQCMWSLWTFLVPNFYFVNKFGTCSVCLSRCALPNFVITALCDIFWCSSTLTSMRFYCSCIHINFLTNKAFNSCKVFVRYVFRFILWRQVPEGVWSF